MHYYIYGTNLSKAYDHWSNAIATTVTAPPNTKARAGPRRSLEEARVRHRYRVASLVGVGRRGEYAAIPQPKE